MARLGIAQIKRMTALMFVGIRYKNPFTITMKKCNGYLRKTFYVDANEQCTLNFTSEMTSGSVKVEVLDANKNNVFILSDHNKEEMLKSNIKTKYYIIFKFDNASGKFTFGWK